MPFSFGIPFGASSLRSIGGGVYDVHMELERYLKQTTEVSLGMPTYEQLWGLPGRWLGEYNYKELRHSQRK